MWDVIVSHLRLSCGRKSCVSTAWRTPGNYQTRKQAKYRISPQGPTTTHVAEKHPEYGRDYETADAVAE